ncbi:S-layer homology domain-containing protein [Pectinatus frisingensis]|jgi:hypothetical protein|uniref:S-layer homology domain-containing protein n=1 Tax=Pectinatus frisingensis TaxID=865 RepID=UPI0015F3C645|nr:S-layer homology domain-containing protein [Pectinatus frisingensis]
MKKQLSIFMLLAAAAVFPGGVSASGNDQNSTWNMEADSTGISQSEQENSIDKADHEKMQKLQEQYEAELIKMQQLRAEYEKELQKMNVNDSDYNSLKEKVDKITLFGFIRAKYDNDDSGSIGAGNNNKHFYMDLEGKMKVSKDWEAHFQSETRKGYTVNQSWRGDSGSGSSDQDGTFQRIWVEGHPGKLGVTVGTKWWGYGFQNVPFGHAADGIQLDYDITKDWNAKVFLLRPRQGDLVTMPYGQDTTIKGVNFTGKLTPKLDTSITLAGNKNYDNNQKMDRMGAFELRSNVAPNLMLTGTYVRTNADDYNTSKECRIDYKGTKLDDIGSFGAYARYINFAKYGDYSHDDEWNSLPSDTKGWIVGVKYVPYKNVEWETFYADQKRNIDTADDHNATRHLFRTQIDFHF